MLNEENWFISDNNRTKKVMIVPAVYKDSMFN